MRACGAPNCVRPQHTGQSAHRLNPALENGISQLLLRQSVQICKRDWHKATQPPGRSVDVLMNPVDTSALPDLLQLKSSIDTNLPRQMW